MNTTQTLQAHLQTTAQNLQPYLQSFPTQIESLIELQKTFADKVKRFENEDQKLSIGIMGQVKAGKSSFLNALLFGGASVLPEAATPKTANLTQITYGNEPKLTVFFYSPAEWQEIEIAGKSGGDHAQAQVGAQLLAMAKDLNVQQVLSEVTKTIKAPDVAGLMNKLNDYVGENGTFTALVKYTEIELPIEELKGYEVVDTPGMNDPVPNRTQKTREYMAKCDVVLFLSRCSQFLDAADTALLMEQLPGEGVKRIHLVACQLDGAIMDAGYDQPSLARTEADIYSRLAKRAETEIGKQIEVRQEQRQNKMAELLIGLKKPIFSSTFAHNFTVMPEESWGKTMSHVHSELQEMAKNVWKYHISKEDFQRIGNFPALQAAYQAARNDKAAILQAQKEGLVPENLEQLQVRRQDLIKAVQSRSDTLRKSDLKNTQKQLDAIEAQTQSIAGKLAELLNAEIEKAKESIPTLRQDIGKEAKQTGKVDQRSGTKIVTREIEDYDVVDDSTWYKPWTWGNTRRRYYTRTEREAVTYAYVDRADTIEKIKRFSKDNEKKMQKQFNGLVHLPTLRNELKKAMFLELSKQKSHDFDPEQFSSTMNDTLNQLELRPLTLSLGDVTSDISRNFSSQVEGSSAVQELERATKASVSQIEKQLLNSFEKAVGVFAKDLGQVRDSLAQKLTDDLREERRRLEVAFANKEQELARYGALLDVCQAI